MSLVDIPAVSAVFLLVLHICLFQWTLGNHFVNEWVAEIAGGRAVAEDVAKRHDFFILEEMSGLRDHYVLHRQDVPHRSKRSSSHHTQKLVDDARVSFVEQQHHKVRVKRGYEDDSSTPDDSKKNSRREIARDIVRNYGLPDDPDLSHMWYINPKKSEEDPGHNLEIIHFMKRDGFETDLRVRDVWKKGITGKNVVVSIIDDGIEKNNTDLMDNYDANASFDINDNDTDPHPRYDPTNENKHGTRCGGEVAMVANNEVCGVGIAFDSKIGGVRLLDGLVTDRTEAFSLSYNRDYIDIYSASWGPNDDGKTTEKPGTLVSKALYEGVTQGRKGKGSIFAWASGNGGRLGDNCNSDGYAGSVYTFSVSSATQTGQSPWYAEKCSSTLVSTYSSGGTDEKKIISTDLNNGCTEQHTGTSAAAPIAAGIIALVLETNPELTWREVQHIALHTARPEPLVTDGWYSNAAGYCVNLAFGFGLMDALGMVELADPQSWVPIGEQHICRVEINEDFGIPASLKSGEYLEVEFTTDGCHGQDEEVNFLEHVQIILDLSYERRGNIYIELESPSGTVTSLMQERHYDSSQKGFKKFPLMSVHTWGESPDGTWKLKVADKTHGKYSGELQNATLVLYGTKEKPAYRFEEIDRCSDNQVQETIEADTPDSAEKNTMDLLLDAYAALQ